MICLTFDTDWMQPDDLQRFLDEYPFAGSGTFFLHRPYTLDGLRGHELCPHPFPVAPDQWKTSIGRLLDELRIAPTGVRTHSAIHSHVLEMVLYELGFRYTSNTSRLFLNDTAPVRLAWGCWEMPIYYMDNLDLTTAKYWPGVSHQPLAPGLLAQAVAGQGLYVFDFHPLHVCLNTPSLEYYLSRQAQLKAGQSPFALRCEGRGVATYFQELCGLMQAQGMASVSLSWALDRFVRCGAVQASAPTEAPWPSAGAPQAA
jgi:hypothetical protein